MKRGQHAADDGSFGRSAGGAMARGIALIVAAVLLGVILLNATDGDVTPVATHTTTSDGKPSTNTSLSTSPTTPTTAAPAAHDPAKVTVLVANGANINGLASKISNTLTGANYVVAQPGNTRAPAETSAVYYTPGYEADAAAIASLLDPHPQVAPLEDPAPVEDLKGANVIVVAAADLATAAG